MKIRKLTAFLLALSFIAAMTGCGSEPANNTSESTSTSVVSTPEPVQEQTAEDSENLPVSLDQYYVNENFMIEMLVNENCVIQEDGQTLAITTSDCHAALVLSIIPGIQNLSAAGELSLSTVQKIFPGATISGMTDGNLFGVRSKIHNYETADDNGNVTLIGLEAAAIVNQSCYFLNVMMETEMTPTEGELIVGVFTSMNVLSPQQVDQNLAEAAYTSHYQEQLDTKVVKPAKQSTQKPVKQWRSLPYDFYSWYGDPGDYGVYPDWYFEPDWNYYSDPGDYWDWGWDDENDWWFYDEYDYYYDYDSYSEYDDYWEGYDPWSDPGDYYDDSYDDSYDDYYDDYYDDGYDYY